MILLCWLSLSLTYGHPIGTGLRPGRVCYSENFISISSHQSAKLSHTNRWREILCSWIKKINLVKLTVLPKTIYRFSAAAAAAAKSLQSCPTLCDPIDGSPPGSPVPGILQARVLE